uniref:Uncharacterized protein n=1 Tax=Peronospora matthiolae TaxID=2874970 RepID=A0AAV1UZB4_9STRA
MKGSPGACVLWEGVELELLVSSEGRWRSTMDKVWHYRASKLMGARYRGNFGEL